MTANSAVHGPNSPNFKLIQDLMVVLLLARIKKMQSKIKALECSQHFPHYNPMMLLNLLTTIMASFLHRVTWQAHISKVISFIQTLLELKKLLKNIDTVYKETHDSTNPMATGPIKGFTFVGRPGFPAKGREYHSGPKYCHICSRKGHSTQDC